MQLEERRSFTITACCLCLFIGFRLGEFWALGNTPKQVSPAAEPSAKVVPVEVTIKECPATRYMSDTLSECIGRLSACTVTQPSTFEDCDDCVELLDAFDGGD